MYQAFQDKLRVVYQQIIRQLKFIQLRDEDGLHLAMERDFELIQTIFQKHPVKLVVTPFVGNTRKIRCHGYRIYNEAYFEEVLINYQVEPRIAQNYRERFMTSNKALNLVLEMYCKNDFISHFLNINIDDLTKKQQINLFCICIRSDAFKIGMMLYLKYINNRDFDSKIMEIVI